MSKEAKVEITRSKPPVLTPGSITPDTLRRFHNACKNYFHIKKVKPEDQVLSVAGNMTDPLISDWYWMDEPRINALTFEPT